jgi:hypothetical protein
MTLGERRAVIDRDGKEAWKWLEWSAMKVRFAKEVLQAAEEDHERRKVAFDALAAALEENNEETRRVDEKIKKLEGTLGAIKRNVGGNVGASASANRGGAPRFPSDVRGPQPALSSRAAGRRAAVVEAAARNASFAKSANGEAPERPAPPPSLGTPLADPAKAKKDDVDHLRDGYAKAYIKKPFFPVRKRASAAAEAPRVSDIDARSEPSAPPLAERERDPPPPTSSFFDAVVGGSLGDWGATSMPRVDSGASGASGASGDSGGGVFPDDFADFGGSAAISSEISSRAERFETRGGARPEENARETQSGGAFEVEAASPASVELRASAVSEEERARHAAVERSRVEAAEARAAARQARERRETLASAASFGGSGSSLDAEVPPPRAFSSADRAPSPPKAPIPPAFAHGDFADFAQFDAAKPSGFEGFPPEPSGAEPSRAPGRASPPAPAPIPPPPGDSSAAAAADLGEPHPPSGPVSANTAHEAARAQMLRACTGLLPSPHAPREGLTAHQKKLGPPPGDFCRPRFCSRECVAASCAGFIQACGGAASAGGPPLDLADVPALTKALKKIAIRNHPDRHSAQRVGAEKAASATVLTQQVSFLQSMLEDFEYVPARVAVSSGGAEPGTQANETVVLPRVHLGATTAQLRDGVIEERPELAAKRDSLGLALCSAPGAAETTVAIGATTLRELGVTKDSTFRMWTWTAAEKSWEAGFL